MSFVPARSLAVASLTPLEVDQQCVGNVLRQHLRVNSGFLQNTLFGKSVSCKMQCSQTSLSQKALHSKYVLLCPYVASVMLDL